MIKILRVPLMKFIKKVYKFDVIQHLKDMVFPSEIEEDNIMEEITPKEIIMVMNTYNVNEKQATVVIVNTIKDNYKKSYLKDYTTRLENILSDKIKSDFIELLKIQVELVDVNAIEVNWGTDTLITSQSLFQRLEYDTDTDELEDTIFDNLDNEIDIVIDSARGSKEYTLKDIEKFI